MRTSRTLLMTGFVAIAACGCGLHRGSESPATRAPQYSALKAPGNVGGQPPTDDRMGSRVAVTATVPFTVCAGSDTWIAPIESEQSAHHWEGNPRFEGVSRLKLWWSFAQDFTRYTGGNSELYDLAPSFGLWKPDPGNSPTAYGHDQMARWCPLDRLHEGREIELWIRGHHALEVGLEDLQYRVSVEPSKGYQVLRLHGPLDPGADWSSAGFRSVDVVITQEGRVLSTLPAPPWVKGSGEHANAISGDEREITGTVEQLDGNAGINIATVGGTVWHLPWREGTVLESADGVRRLHTMPVPGSLVEVAGFVLADRDGMPQLAAVRIRELDPQRRP